MSDDLEELLSLEDVRKLLVNLFFNEHRVGDLAREEGSKDPDVLTQEIKRLIFVALDKWREAQNQSTFLDPTLTGRTPREKDEHQQLLHAKALQRFEELLPSDDLRRIRKIDLTIEQWAGILERELLAQAKQEVIE